MGTRKRNYDEGWPFGRPVVLHGEDAVRFMKEISDPKPATEEERRRVREAGELLQQIADFRI